MWSVKFITLKWGTKYGAEYVNRLYRTIKNTYTGNFDFYCFTDIPYNLECKTIPISTLSSYKSSVFTAGKLDLFDSLPFEGPYVLLDLDILIQKDLYSYFKDYNFNEPRFIYNYWSDNRRLYRSYFTGDCFINSSFVTWNGDQLKWLKDKFYNNLNIATHKFKSLDKFIFYSSRHLLNYHPEKIIYNYSDGANFKKDFKQDSYRPEYYICLFNTSHKAGTELHDADGWAKDLWVKYD